MTDAIERKIWEYHGKINDCDKKIGGLSSRKNVIRRRLRSEEGGSEEDQYELESIKRDEIRVEAQRQAYVQANHDFDSLLDEI